MTDRLTSRRVVLLMVFVSAFVILISGPREWVSGSVDDAVTGASALHGSGSAVAPGAMAAAFVALASAVAAATGGTFVRVVAACAALLAAILGAVVVISILADPAAALSGQVSAQTGHSGSVAVHARGGSWAWSALAATLVMGLGGLGALIGGRRWDGLSGRYSAPVASRAYRQDPAGQGANGSESAWDELSRGEDPTA
jgi:uncharacterized membrane protein (TIGR02234 family)